MADLPPALVSKSVERTRISRKVQSEERRERVLERLTQVFAKRGYQAATIDHLLAGAKISMGGFYKDFKGKEDCFVQVYDRALAEVRSRFAAAVPARSDWATEATLGLRTVVEFASEQPMAARVVLLEAQTGGALALARYGETVGEAARFLRRGREAAEPGASLPESFEDATVSGLVWLLQSRLAKGKVEDAERLWRQIALMVLEPYLGAARAEQALRVNS